MGAYNGWDLIFELSIWLAGNILFFVICTNKKIYCLTERILNKIDNYFCKK